MGMYTAISLGVELKDTTPRNIIHILRYMVGDLELFGDFKNIEELEKRILVELGELPNHELFKSERWNYMLRCDSYYFSWKTKFQMELDQLAEYYKERYGNRWYLTGVSNFKNYNNEIELFLDWLHPYIETNGFIGWTMYEGDYAPTIIFNSRERGCIEYFNTEPAINLVSSL